MFRKEKTVLNYLDMTPVHLVRFDEEGGKVVLFEPKFKRAWLKKLVSPLKKSEFIKVKLDEFGSDTWRLIDGKRNVREISTELIKIFGDQIEPAELRVTKFLTSLMHNDYITFLEIMKKGNS